MHWIMSQKSKLLNLVLPGPESGSVMLGKGIYCILSLSHPIGKNEEGEFQSFSGASQLNDSKEHTDIATGWFNIFRSFGSSKQIYQLPLLWESVCLHSNLIGGWMYMADALGCCLISLQDQYIHCSPVAAHVVCGWLTAEFLLKSPSQLKQAVLLKAMPRCPPATYTQWRAKARVFKHWYRASLAPCIQ